MATLIALAQGIETDYQGEISGSVKVCRPNMSEAIGSSNLPYIREMIGIPDSQASGIVYGYLLIKAQTNLSGDFVILYVGVMFERDNSNSYSLLVDGRVALDNYKSVYRPFTSESDSLLTYVLDYFANTRGLLFAKKIDIQIGTPVYGHVQGQKTVGDGVGENDTALSETWVFQASYPWGTPGNIVSWKE